MANMPFTPESERFNMLLVARSRRDMRRGRLIHQGWLAAKLADENEAWDVIEIPNTLVGNRNEHALRALFKQACERMNLDVVYDVQEVSDGQFVLVNWDADTVKDALSMAALT